MAWIGEVPTFESARERAEKAFSLPLGLASPLWAAFGAAASVGVAWWWMTRWSQAVNLEAMLAAPSGLAVEPAPAILPTPALAPEPPVSPPVIAAPPIAPPPSQAATPAPSPAPATPVKTVAKPAPAPEPAVVSAPDDLTRLVGIGAKLADALAKRGVTRFEHIAKWKEKDLARIDVELKLLGRATRDAWVAQAKRFAAEA